MYYKIISVREGGRKPNYQTEGVTKNKSLQGQKENYGRKEPLPPSQK